MKRLLLILSVLFSVHTFAQVTYFYKDTVAGGRCVRVAWPNLPDSIESVWNMPGAGQVGAGTLADTVLIKQFGFEFWRLSGALNSGVALGNGTHYPAIITIIFTSAFERPFNLKPAIDAILASHTWKLKVNARHCQGFSAGGWAWSEFNTYQATTGNNTYFNYFRSEVDVEGVVPDDTYDASLPYPQKFGHRTVTTPFSFLGFEQINDTRGIWAIRDNINDSFPGHANFAWSNFAGGFHSNFNDFLNPAVTNWTASNTNLITTTNGQTSNFIAGGQSVIQWMLRQGDTTLPNNNPIVDAGPNQILQVPTSQATLTGTATGRNGAIITSVLWTKISGPGATTILNNSSLTATATGLQVGAYTFQLRANDNLGNTNIDSVHVNIITGPIARAGGTYVVTRENGYLIMLDGTGSTGSNLKYKWAYPGFYYGNDKVTPVAFTGAESITGQIKSPFTAKCYFIQACLLNQDSIHTYKVGLTATDSVTGQSNTDSATIILRYGTRFPPQSTAGSFHYATSTDLANWPGSGMAIGDPLVDGASTNFLLGQNTDIDIRPNFNNTFFTTGTTHNIWIVGGVYRRISMQWDTLGGSQGGPLQAPAGMYDTLHVLGGQLECSSFYISNTRKLVISGQYIPSLHMGNVNFQGHGGGYAYSQEKYDIFVNNMFQSIENLNFQWDGFSTDSCELAYVASGYGGFTGFTLKPELGTHPGFHWHNFKVHDNIAFLVHGEGFYLGSANSDPVMTWVGLQFYNNRSTMTGNKLFKISQMYSGCLIHNNTGWYGSINYRSPFEENVSNGMELFFRNGGNVVYNNMINGASEQLFNIITGKLDAFTGLSNTLRNNAGIHSTGFIGNFVGQLDSAQVLTLDSMMFGNHAPFLDSIVYPPKYWNGTDSVTNNGTNTPQTIRALPNGALPNGITLNTINLTNTTYDLTKATLTNGAATFTQTNTVLVNLLPLPRCANSGFEQYGNTYPEQMVDTIMGMWKDEFAQGVDTRQGKQTSYHIGDVVHWFKNFYVSNVNHNTSMPGLDGNWTIITFSNGGNLPPMDYRLVNIDPYAIRGIGLFDQAIITVNLLMPVNLKRPLKVH